MPFAASAVSPPLQDGDQLAAVDIGSNSFHLVVARYTLGQLRVVDRLRETVRMADGLEQAFLSEMLKYTNSRENPGEFGGGIGESQFSSMLNDTYAQRIAEKIDLRLNPRK